MLNRTGNTEVSVGGHGQCNAGNQDRQYQQLTGDNVASILIVGIQIYEQKWEDRGYYIGNDQPVLDIQIPQADKCKMAKCLKSFILVIVIIVHKEILS